MNPYAPPTTKAEALPAEPLPLVISYRWDWLIAAAALACIVESFSIYLFHSAGTGIISGPILRPLANRSLIWIPVYRLLIPLLFVPVMPPGVRHAFASFFLAFGVLFGINNFLGHFFGHFVFVDTIGSLPTGLFCMGIGFFAMVYHLQNSSSTIHSLRNIGFWLIATLCLQGIFWLISKIP